METHRMTTQKAPAVFVVDDDPAVRDSLRILLQAYGIYVRDYGSALKFLADYDTSEPACLILDLDMPAMSGIELMALLRDRGAPIRVIVLTGRSNVRMPGDLPVATILAKPADMDRLLEAINRILASAASVASVSNASDGQACAIERSFAQ
jgi:two-component system response regulator FixJ